MRLAAEGGVIAELGAGAAEGAIVEGVVYRVQVRGSATVRARLSRHEAASGGRGRGKGEEARYLHLGIAADEHAQFDKQGNHSSALLQITSRKLVPFNFLMIAPNGELVTLQ